MRLKRYETQRSEDHGSSACRGETIPSVQQVVLFAFIATSKEADREHCEGLLIRGTDLPRNELRL
jgi:hypothetical protein